MSSFRPTTIALLWSSVFFSSAAPASAQCEVHENARLTVSDGATGDQSSQAVSLDGTGVAVWDVRNSDATYRIQGVPSAVIDDQVTDGPLSRGSVALSIERSPGMGFCPQPGMLLWGTVRTDSNGIFWLRGVKIVRAAAEANECLFAGASDGCYQPLEIPDRPLNDQQGADLARLIGSLPPTCDAWDGACDPCVVTDFTINSRRYLLGCGSHECCADTLVLIGRLLDDVARAFVVDLDAFEGLYPQWGAQQRHSVDLGFSLFDIDRVALYWAGSVYTGVFRCSQQEEYCGIGGFFDAALAGSGVSQELLYSQPDTWVPFSAVAGFDLDFAPGLNELLDGMFDIQITFPWMIQEWYMLVSPAGLLDSAVLLVTGRRMHDADSDGLVSGADFASFSSCLGGPGTPGRHGCEIFDADRDQDVDLLDAAGLQLEFDAR